MTERETTLERTAFVVLAACLGLVQFNLLAAETLFGVAALFYVKSTMDWRSAPRDN